MSLSATYRTSVLGVLAVVEGLTPADLTRVVPACPAWTAHDLLAHLAGSSTDFVRRNLLGVTSPGWTARQVEDRRDRTGAQLVEELTGNVDAVAPLCDVLPSPNPAWDVAVHLADLREAVGRPPLPPEQGWSEVLDVTTAFLAERAGVTFSVAERGADPGTTTWHAATAYGLWRALFSRLDRPALEAEILRGDVAALRAVAFFGDGSSPKRHPPTLDGGGPG